MRQLQHVTARLARADMVQALTLFFAVLVVVTSVAWPASGGSVNESWFSLAPVRNALLALAAAAFGAGLGPAQPRPGEVTVPWRPEARHTLAALLAWALLTLPFEVMTHAASYPAVSLGWSLLVTLLTVPAYFGLGLALHRLSGWLRLGWALPLAVPGAIVLLAWFDLRLDETLFNPWAAPLAPTFAFPAIAGAGALLTLLALTLAPRRREVASA